MCTLQPMTFHRLNSKGEQGRKPVRCMHIGSLNKSAKWQAALLLSDVDTRHGSVLWSENSCPALIYELSIKKKREEVV